MEELLRRLRRLLHRDQFEQDLDEEMRHHLALKAEEMGSTFTASHRFGNVTLWKEDSRSMWTWRFTEQLAQDLRYAGRMMAANRLFTAMAVLSLALGIGANTAIYSFLDAILLRSLPVLNPRQLVVLNWHAKVAPAVIHGQNGARYRGAGNVVVSPNFPFAAYAAFDPKRELFSELFTYASPGNLNVVARQQAESLKGVCVSGNFFAGIGAPPFAGRLIAADDDRAGATPVTVLAYDYWKRRFDMDPSVIGQSILVNNMPFTVIGVGPEGFRGVNPQEPAAMFLPLHALPSLTPRPAVEEQRRFFDRNFYWLEMMGRLRPGVDMARAQAALAAEYRQFADSTATTAKEKSSLPDLWTEPGSAGIDALRRQYARPVWVLMTMVGLILTIACANIANLLLARAAARKREMAVRLSLGAGRARIMRQLLTESVLLSLLGGLLGLLVAFWGIRSIAWLLSNGRDAFPVEVGLNLPVLGFTLLLSLVTGVVFGLAPAFQATRVDLTPALKEARASESRSSHRGWRIPVGLGHCLVVAQIAISLLLVIGAALFVHSLANLNAVPLGFNRENLLVFKMNARQAGYGDAAIAPFFNGLLERFRAIPGVRSASFSDYPLVAHYWNDKVVNVPGAANASQKARTTAVLSVDPSFLATMQIPVLWGRGIEPRDMLAPRVAVVTEKFVKEFFGQNNPVGRMVAMGEANSPADIEIIGVARTSQYSAVNEDPPPVAYVPYTQNPGGMGRAAMVIRTSGEPLVPANAVRQIVHDADSKIPITDLTTESRQIDEGISQQRTFANLCSCFAVLALVIACVGLYGSMAYAVARRTGEIGIRMALGAGRRTIVWMVLREVLVLAAVGLAIGLGTAWETTHLIASFLFGTKPNDPQTLAVAIAILAAAALAAGYAPAWRAAKTEPMTALRHQ